MVMVSKPTGFLQVQPSSQAAYPRPGAKGPSLLSKFSAAPLARHASRKRGGSRCAVSGALERGRTAVAPLKQVWGHSFARIRSSSRSSSTLAAPISALGDSLEEFLVEASDDPKLRQILMSMGEAIRTIAYKVKTASCSGSVCINSFADEQMTVRLLADRVLFEALRYSGVCKLACSEEVPEPIDLGGDGFSVAFDPLDGSTVVDTNFTVGTIFGVWPGDELLGVKGYQQAASGIGIYGPRTGFCITIASFPGTHEFALQDDGKWMHVKETTSIGEGKLFSPGNLRATFDNPGYQELISYYTRERYTLRYTGGMVPDVFQIIVKEMGVFTNVASPSSLAKPRMLFEVAPLAMLVEKAGGHTSGDGKPDSALAITIKDFEQRSPAVCFGSRAEVERFETIMYGSAPRFDPMANYRDPIEEFCQSSPDADECRVYDG